MKQRLTNEEIASVCTRLGHLVHAGVVLGSSAELLGGDLGKALDRGLPLWEAMASAAFPPSVTALVRIGEETGKLEQALFALADYHTQRHRTVRLLQSAIHYPAMTLGLMGIVVGVLLVKVLPIFDQVYASLGSRLTGVAAGLLHLGGWIQAALPVLFAVLGLGLVLAVLFAKWAAFREKVTGIWQKHLGDRGISRKFNNARFAQGLAMAMGSGMALEEALELSANLMEDPGSAGRCRSCANAVKGGADLTAALEENGLLDNTGCALLQLGLRSGSADAVMTDIARQQMERAEEDLDRAIAAVEPTMVLLASVLVGLILLSVMLPLMNILSALG